MSPKPNLALPAPADQPINPELLPAAPPPPLDLADLARRDLTLDPPAGYPRLSTLQANLVKRRAALGEKLSKSKGNGLSIEEWLTYAAPESLSL